jgi:hypothetical protein
MQVQDVSATGGDAQLSTAGYYDVPYVSSQIAIDTDAGADSQGDQHA